MREFSLRVNLYLAHRKKLSLTCDPFSNALNSRAFTDLSYLFKNLGYTGKSILEQAED